MSSITQQSCWTFDNDSTVSTVNGVAQIMDVAFQFNNERGSLA